MAYPEIIHISKRICREFGLREKLWCEYQKTEHTIREDFPPDLVLRDQEPPDMILKDEVTGEFWAFEFGTEIVVNPFPFAATWRTGIVIDGNWNLRMINGEMVISSTPLAEPKAEFLLDQAGFKLSVVAGELVYEEKTAMVGQEFFNLAWAFYFKEEIIVMPWPYITPINGIFLAKQSPTWFLQMKRGEIVVDTGPETSLGVPFLRAKPDRWKFGLEVVGGELVYNPYFENSTL